MRDKLIKGVRVTDPSGGAPFWAEVAASGGRIAEVSEIIRRRPAFAAVSGV